MTTFFAVIILAASTTAPIVVAPEHQFCEKNNECMQVRTHCGCESCGQPVRLMYGPRYVKLTEAACKGYDGPQCDMPPCPKTARCVEKRCAMVAK